LCLKLAIYPELYQYSRSAKHKIPLITGFSDVGKGVTNLRIACDELLGNEAIIDRGVIPLVRKMPPGTQHA